MGKLGENGIRQILAKFGQKGNLSNFFEFVENFPKTEFGEFFLIHF